MNEQNESIINKNPIKIYAIEPTPLAKSYNKTHIRTYKPENCDLLYFSGRVKSKETGIKYIDENTTDKNIKKAYELSVKYNKKLIYFCGGDVPPIIFPNYKNIYVLNTSVVSSKKPSNEFVVGVLVKDKFSHYIEEKDIKLSIGFVGQKLHNRQKYLTHLEQSIYNSKNNEDKLNGKVNNKSLTTNFITRDTYIHKLRDAHIREFDNNMISNLFTFCYRGRGNFSVRFYETLMHGRIPVVIKTDCEFPYEDKINYDSVGLFVDEKDLNENNNLDKLLVDFYNNKTKEELVQIQKNNRQLYLDYFHIKTYYDSIFSYFNEVNQIV